MYLADLEEEEMENVKEQWVELNLIHTVLTSWHIKCTLPRKCGQSVTLYQQLLLAVVA